MSREYSNNGFGPRENLIHVDQFIQRVKKRKDTPRTNMKSFSSSPVLNHYIPDARAGTVTLGKGQQKA